MSSTADLPVTAADDPGQDRRSRHPGMILFVIVGAQHEILMEQDRFRSQFWAAFDAFVPGTPLY